MFSFTSVAATAALTLRVASAADVLAHFMVQNSYAYDVDQWKTDMAAAQQVGIDGFALNWIPPDCQSHLGWTEDRIGDAFTAAESMNFKLVHSFDMSYSECNKYWNQTYMADILTRYAGNPATYRWNSNILVTTYGGDRVDEYGNEFFQGLKDKMKYEGNAISLSPALVSYSERAQNDPESTAKDMVDDFSSIDGFLNWQAWPLNTDSNMTCTPDQAFQSQLKKNGKTGPYIMAVSPWQYKDLNNGNPMDAWVAYSDTLFPKRFESLTSQDDINPDIIELLTWNDFCESHYIRNLPSDSTSATDYVEMGEMGNYVKGQNHAPWRIIAKYYIAWWKTGKAPAITMDQVVFWYRVHPKDANCPLGASTKIRNSDYVEDAVFAWALVSDSSTISMSVGSNKYYEFHADASGPSMSSVPFPSDLSGGLTPEVAIMRDGNTIQHGKGSQEISASCEWENFNPNVNLVGPGVNSGLVS